MDSVATLRERLLLLAQVRLKNRPLVLEALRHEFSDDARLRGWPTLEKKLLALSLSTKTVARALRGPDGNDQNLVALIDDWLASRTATEPRALPPGDHSPTSEAAHSARASSAMLARGESGNAMRKRSGRPCRLELPSDQLVKFGDLPALMAAALDSDEMVQALAVQEIRKELQRMVDAGTLQVLNPLTMGPHSLPRGNALDEAVLLPWSLRPLMESRGIELHLLEAGNGPEFWTIGNAAREVGRTQGWTQASTATLCRQMLEAAVASELDVRHPHTDLPIPRSERANVCDYYELVTRDDVNRWLESIRAPYRWATNGEAASGSTERDSRLDDAANKRETDRGRRVKRAALIADNIARWPTIERDLKDAAKNGLSGAARDETAIGWWWEGRALEWARARAKASGDTSPALAGFPGTIHRLKR